MGTNIDPRIRVLSSRKTSQLLNPATERCHSTILFNEEIKLPTPREMRSKSKKELKKGKFDQAETEEKKLMQK